MNATKRSCKYVETCGSNENCLNCTGYERKSKRDKVGQVLRHKARQGRPYRRESLTKWNAGGLG